ncbi:MAG: hypothetical protein AAGE52_18905 [Myxococcota bacterium]
MARRVLVLALGLIPTLALAQEPRSAQLDFGSSVEGCPTPERFGDEVAARVGRIVFQEEGDLVRVRVFADGDEVVASVEMGGDSRVFRDVSCNEALEAAAAAVAVWIDETPRVGILGALRGSEIPESFGVGGLGVQAEPDDGRVALRVSTDETEELTFHIETNTGRGQVGARFFERLCVMPCETRVHPGVQQFGIAYGNGIAWALPNLTEITEDSELFIHVRRRSPWNVVGGILAATGLLLVAPIAIPITAVKRDDFGDAPLWTSVGLSVAMIVGGILMVSFSDSGGTEVELRPLGAQ